jgi:hypothetical protein
MQPLFSKGLRLILPLVLREVPAMVEPPLRPQQQRLQPLTLNSARRVFYKLEKGQQQTLRHLQANWRV